MIYPINKTDDIATFALPSRTLRFDCNAKDAENSQRTQKRSFMPGLKGKYDAWNRLVEVKDLSDNLIARYDYNDLNQRITKTVGGVTMTSFFNERWQELEAQEPGAQATGLTTYIWGNRYIDDLVLREKGAEKLYSLADPNWNVVALTNASGTVQERMKYDGFGKVSWLDAAFATLANSAYDWNRTFTGQVLEETGLMLYRNRYYHTGLGRLGRRQNGFDFRLVVNRRKRYHCPVGCIGSQARHADNGRFRTCRFRRVASEQVGEESKIGSATFGATCFFRF